MTHELFDADLSIRDFAAQQAQHSLRGDDYAHWANANILGFPEISKEAKAEMFDGYLITYTGLPANRGQYFKLEGSDTYLPVPAGTEGALLFNAHVAMAYTQQQFGALRANQPNLHAILKGYRDAFSKFANNKLQELIKRWKLLYEDKGSRTRAVNSTFIEAVAKSLDALETRNKNALAKGDDSAVGVERFKAARAAFMRALAE